MLAFRNKNLLRYVPAAIFCHELSLEHLPSTCTLLILKIYQEVMWGQYIALDIMRIYMKIFKIVHCQTTVCPMPTRIW